MPNSKSRLDKERKTVRTMIKMYCRKFHDSKNNFCENCLELYEYANERLTYCHFGENKPTCEKCPIHCYKPVMREKARKVMRPYWDIRNDVIKMFGVAFADSSAGQRLIGKLRKQMRMRNPELEKFFQLFYVSK